MVEENGLETNRVGNRISAIISCVITHGDLGWLECRCGWAQETVDTVWSVRQYITDDVTTVIAPTGLWFLVLKLYSFLFSFVLFFS